MRNIKEFTTISFKLLSNTKFYAQMCHIITMFNIYSNKEEAQWIIWCDYFLFKCFYLCFYLQAMLHAHLIEHDTNLFKNFIKTNLAKLILIF